jgi:hypothetical protein
VLPLKFQGRIVLLLVKWLFIINCFLYFIQECCGLVGHQGLKFVVFEGIKRKLKEMICFLKKVYIFLK